MTRLVVGLGNPGPEYEWTRHNVGFHVVERLAGEEGAIFEPARRLPGFSGPGNFSFARSKRFDALYVKPLTFMNLSGTAVNALVRELQVDPGSMLVVYDDLDLDLGRLRIRPHGGPGTHNGMRSLVASLGTDRFPRVRVGIGPSRTDAARHVLERFSDAEMPDAEISVAEAADAIRAWLAGEDLESVMTRFHSRWNLGS
ncbi:MAG: aminoacyl-tRNA hydrolase [Planctomycetes bacterium]|nr:aminoacyl-tRNA hydrolase [Planctomycetota bacterium]